jgi:hypothetical protein
MLTAIPVAVMTKKPVCNISVPAIMMRNWGDLLGGIRWTLAMHMVGIMTVIRFTMPTLYR